MLQYVQSALQHQEELGLSLAFLSYRFPCFAKHEARGSEITRFASEVILASQAVLDSRGNSCAPMNGGPEETRLK